jgi:LmbE family N-acetylglucosaminyl deacetylase
MQQFNLLFTDKIKLNPGFCYFYRCSDQVNHSSMNKFDATRREFVKLSGAGIGGFVFSPFAGLEKDLRGKPVAKQLNIFCVGAHPGDPEFGCGGTLARYSDAGHRVSVLYLTRGEAGDPSKTFEESAALRTREAETACSLLKIKPLFAGQTDGNTILNKASIDAIAGLIQSEKPDILFAHWPLDGHPDHQVAGMLSFNAWTRLQQTFELYFYEVNTGVETMDFEPTDYVDISSVREKKKSAMFAHKTQDPEKVYDLFFRTLEDFRGLQSGVKAAEAFIHFKSRNQRATLAGL